MKQILKAEQEVKIKHFNFLLVIFFLYEDIKHILGVGGIEKTKAESTLCKKCWCTLWHHSRLILKKNAF